MMKSEFENLAGREVKKKDNHCSGRPCDKSRGGRCDKKRELAVATV